jgi:hypothetical protein
MTVQVQNLDPRSIEVCVTAADIQAVSRTAMDTIPPTMQAPKEFDTVELCIYDSPSLPVIVMPMEDQDRKNLKGGFGLWVWAAESLGIQPWGQILLVVLGGAALLLWNWHSDTVAHLNKIDATVAELPLQISRDLLSQANTDVTIGRPARALSATEAASAIIAQATVRRIAATPDYFAGAVEDLNLLTSRSRDPNFSKTVNSTRLVLAEYRSALEAVPELPSGQASQDGTFQVVHASTNIQPSDFGNATVLIFPPGVQDFGTPFVRRLSDDIYIEDLTIKGGEQNLDGIHWNNVVFLNTLIKYDGDEVELHNVRFVNCVFDMPDSPRTARMANYAALHLSDLIAKSGS